MTVSINRTAALTGPSQGVKSLQRLHYSATMRHCSRVLLWLLAAGVIFAIIAGLVVGLQHHSHSNSASTATDTTLVRSLSCIGTLSASACTLHATLCMQAYMQPVCMCGMLCNLHLSLDMAMGAVHTSI